MTHTLGRLFLTSAAVAIGDALVAWKKGKERKSKNV